MSKDLVRRYYASFGENEWRRLERPEGVVEFLITTRALEQHLPATGRVLDLGGATGRYTIWLAQHGYRIVLADLSPELLAIAHDKIQTAGVQANVEAIVPCDACDLAQFPDQSFDSVLCLGPFYHLIEPADRERAAAEVARVLRPGGHAFVAYMPIYNFLLRTLALADERRHLADPAFVTRLMRDGVFLNDVPGRFNSGYGVEPQAIAPFWEARGFNTVTLLADSGFAAAYVVQLAELAQTDPAAYEALLELIVKSASDPSIHGASVHLLYIGQKGLAT